MDKLFLTVLNMSLTGAFVIAAICLARLPLKKAPKIISYCLWAVAGFRLVFPFSIESIFSLIPFKPAPIPTDIAMQAIPRIDIGVPFINNAVSGILPAAAPAESVNPLQIWTAVGSCVWIAGVAVMLVYGVASFIVLKRKMRGAAHIEANIYDADNIKSPFVLGILKPKIYLPPGLSDREREYIVLHERTHIRRRDHIVKIAAYSVLCLHWFNPLVWAAFMLLGVDMEMSCDERVLNLIGERKTGETKKSYSLSLLSLATERRVIGGSPLAFGESGIKERVKNVLNFKKPSRIIVAAAVALVTVLSVGFAVNRVNTVNAEPKINPLMTALGYTVENLEIIKNNQTPDVNDGEKVATIISLLPEPWKGNTFESYSAEPDGNGGYTLLINYNDIYETQDDANPFREAIYENNSLLLLAAVENLSAVFYTREVVTDIFGGIPSIDDLDSMYNKLSGNLKTTESYFMKPHRYYLGYEPESITYRYGGEPHIMKTLPNGLTVYVYEEVGKTYYREEAGNQYSVQSPDEHPFNEWTDWVLIDPGNTHMFYFTNHNGMYQLFATRVESGLYTEEQYKKYYESYDDIITRFGPPKTEKMIDGKKYISYLLRKDSPDEPDKYVYYVFEGNMRVEFGLMYGDDYSLLN